MELRFKPQFRRDYLKIKNRKIKVLLAAHLRRIADAETILDTGNYPDWRSMNHATKSELRLTRRRIIEWALK